MHRQRYYALIELFDEGDTDKCMEEAKRNLTHVLEHISLASLADLTFLAIPTCLPTSS
jgi:hypothetical protein